MKKGMMKAVSFAAGIIMFLAASCSSDAGSSGGKSTIAATSVEVKDETGATEGYLYIGDDTEVTLTATVSPENATVKKVEWTVTDSDAVTIVEKTDSTCKIKAGTKAADGVLVTAKVTGSTVIGSYTVNVGLELAKISVVVPESVKKAYTFKEQFDATGVGVKAIYTDGSEKDVTDSAVFTFGENKVSELNTFQKNASIPVYVSYTENGITKESEDAVYWVSVDTGDWELGNIIISTAAAKAEYNVGDAFDGSGVTATGQMVNSKSGEVDSNPVDLTGLLTFEGFDSSASYLGTEDSYVTSKKQVITASYDATHAASYEVTISAIPVTSVTLSDTALSIYKNKEKTVTVKVLPENATFKKVNWSVSGNEAGYVTVTDAEGGKKITAGETVTESPVTITATLAGDSSKTASCTVSVKEQPKVTAWEFTNWSSETKTNVAADSTWVKNAETENRYKMNVDGEAVANGAVIKELEGITFDKAATVLISWDSSKGSYLQTATSMEIPVEAGYEITFSAANTGSKNGTRKLVVVENGVATTVLSSGNTTKATGKYTPKAGTSSIIVSSPDGAFNFYSIKGPVHATGLNLTIDGSNSVTLKEGVAKNITATITPSDAAEKEITWTSDKPAIVKVENGKITPLAVSGETVTITAELANGVSATFTVNGVAEAVKPTKVSMVGPSSVEKMGLNSSKELSVSFEPANVEATAIIWTSSDATTVSVNENGVIKALKASTTPVTITATTVNGLKATYTVNEVIDPASITGSIVFSEEGGWMRACYAEWYPVNDATVTGYNAYVSKDGTNWTKLDAELIREYADYFRVDAMGLAAGNYSIKVTAVSESGETSITGTTGNLEVLAYDRNGFAFHKGYEPGAYKADGTLKDNAVVLYVNNANFNSVKVTVKDSKGVDHEFTGLQELLDTSGFWKYTSAPLVIRVLGKIDTTGFPSSSWGSGEEGLQVKCNKIDQDMNFTIEGVGDDAVFHGFGVLCRQTKGVELCNFAEMAFADDGISLDTDNYYTWVHNLDIFYGSTGGDSDQAKGDGSLDVKGDSRYQTYSYIHFWDSGKMSLCGMKSETGPNYITYHHNWFDHSDSRHPRVRTMTVHVYNNYYDGNAKYGAGATTGADLFVENNYFRNVKFPMMSSLQGNDVYAGSSKYDPANYGTFSGETGGSIKSYGNKIVDTISNSSYWPYGAASILAKGSMVSASSLGIDTKVHFDAYEVENRSDTVPSTVSAFDGGDTYSNFDTDSQFYIASLVPDSPDVAKDKVVAYAGRMNGGDFKWSFSASDDENSGVDAVLKSAVVNYTSKIKKSTASGGVTGGYVEGGGASAPADPTPTDPVAPSLTLDKTTATVAAGSTVMITATAKNGEGSVTWTSSDNTIATVNDGTVTGVKAGTATITATYGELTKTCTVTVSAPNNSKSWNAGDNTTTWMSGLSGSVTSFSRAGTFADGTQHASYVQVNSGSSLTVTLPTAGTVKIYALALNNSDKTGSTYTIGSGSPVPVTLKGRDTTNVEPFSIAAGSGETVTMTMGYNAAVFAVKIE